MSKKQEHNKGQRDGAAYRKQGTIDKVVNPKYHPPKDSGLKKTYDKGHKHGRR